MMLEPIGSDNPINRFYIDSCILIPDEPWDKVLSDPPDN